MCYIRNVFCWPIRCACITDLCELVREHRCGRIHSLLKSVSSFRSLVVIFPNFCPALTHTSSMRNTRKMALAWSVLLLFGTALGQQQCYFSAGAQYRAESQVVPCNGTGASTCCLLGDTCLSGNTCYNHATGNLYQYGCTDINYKDGSCPYKCGLDPNKSPWIALEYCQDVQDLSNTWICHSPDSCGCDWQSSSDLLVLQPRGCKEMGSDALVALYAPDKLAPYVSLPSSIGGSTGYYSPTVSAGSNTWVETAVPGYTPTPFTQLTTYRDAPTTPVQIQPDATPGPSTYASAASYTAPSSRPTTADGSDTTADSESSSATGSGDASLATHSDTPDAGLSTGAKAGIGVGAAAGLCLVVALVVALILLRRRRNNEPKAQATHPPAPSYPGTPHMQQQRVAPYAYGPPMQGMNWAPPYPQGQLSEAYPSYHQDRSPHTPQSELSRGKSQNAPSYKSRSPPVPSPPMELAADATRQLIHEIDSHDARVDMLDQEGRGSEHPRGERF
ncbi:hypothetical protein AC579_2990 [Pseudocercospora musae]|uniref:Uncharacterized protein n=1 Tax=Pseudocercospora musae TaxID=113226 RepID=A0A139I1B1_9PEZI|nr:hypothetical protein AC579_2990 [Pseudocercospora musae]